MAAKSGIPEKLYVLMYHGDPGPYIHTLYALDIPCESTPSLSELPPPAIGAFPDLDAADNEPGRQSVDPIISFPRDIFPGLMGCVRFDSKLYFMGGIIGFDEETAHYTPDVYILDLKKTTRTSLTSLPPERRWEVLEKAPPMRTGKYSPLAFEFGGRIFVLSGHDVCPDTGVHLTPCEVFTPAANGGTWEAVEPHPYTTTLYNYVIVGGRLIIYTEMGHHFWFDPNAKSGKWDGPIKGIDFRLGESCLFVEATLYSCCNAQRVVALRCSDMVALNVLFEDMVELKVIKSRIMSSRPSSLLVYMGGSKRFCFLQAACPWVLNPDGRSVSDSPFTGHFNLTVFEADPAANPKFLYSAHYSTKIGSSIFIASEAHIV